MDRKFLVGEWTVEPAVCRLSKDGQAIHVRAKVMDLLVFFAARPDEVVSKEALLDGVWGTSDISESALTRTMTELRQALGDSVEFPRILETIPKRGYRLMAPVFNTDHGIREAPAPGRTHTATPVRGTRSLARSLRPWLLLAAALCVFVTLLVWNARSTGRVATTDGPSIDPNRVAVLSFSYRGADAHAYLREGMVDLLSRSLDGAGPLRTVDPRAVFAVFARLHPKPRNEGVEPANVPSESAVTIAGAKELGAGQYVSGDIVEAAGMLRITARLHRVGSNREPASAGVEGPPDTIFAMVDDLTRQLAIAGGASPRLLTTAARMTASLDALKAFLQGEQFYRGGTGGPQQKALKAFDTAVQIDPTFAIAWYRLSQVAYFSGFALGKVPEFAESAARHSAKLPWRERRLIEANWAYARGAARESKLAYQEILRTHPDDTEALFGIGLLGSEYGWLLGEPPNWYRKPLTDFLRYVPDHLTALEILRNIEARDRNCVEVNSLNRRMYPSGAPPLQRAIEVFCGPRSEAQEALLRAPGQWPQNLRIARLRVDIVSENPRAAAVFARAVVEAGGTEPFAPPDAGVRMFDVLSLAELELAQGHRGAAEKVFAQLASLNPSWALADGAYRALAPYHLATSDQLRSTRDQLQRWEVEAVPPVGGEFRQRRHDGIHAHLRKYLLGRITAQLGDPASGRRLADELDQLASPTGVGSLGHDLAQSVRAFVLNGEGRFEQALQALESATREVPFDRRLASWAFTEPQERFLRAELLTRLGRHEEGLRWYQSIGESVMAGPSHLRQAEIHERLGQPSQAIDQYKRFIELWQDCDEEFRPLVQKAESEVRRLTTAQR